MYKIPKIIHQIYVGQPSDLLLNISKTWLDLNPSFEYRFWDASSIDEFLIELYPNYVTQYFEFKYEVQRWDFIRYLIMYHFGGIYVDMDYECLESIDPIINGKSCCFGLEPLEHCTFSNREYVISNAFIAAERNHPFLKLIIDNISNIQSKSESKFEYVLETTGPIMLSNLYEKSNKEVITLIPSELICPLSAREVKMVMAGNETNEISIKIEKAYAVHYFFGSWLK